MDTQKSLSNRAWAEIVLLACLWGGSFLAIRIALDEIGVMTSVAHRVFWGALALWLVVALRRLPVPGSPRVWASLFAMGLLNNILPFSLMAWGQLYISTGLTSILNASTSVFGILIAAMVFADERLSPARALGVALGFFGVAIVVGLGNLARFDPSSVGQLAVIAGAVSYGLAGVWARLHLSDLSPVTAAAGMLTCSSLVAIPAAIWTDGLPRVDLAAPTIAAIAYYALASTALAYLFYYRILRMAGSGNLLLCTLLIPPIAIALGAWIRAEVLSPQALIGFAVLTLGLIVIDGRVARAVSAGVARSNHGASGSPDRK